MQDPNGLAPSDPGAKLDKGKPRAGLVLKDFSKALREVINVGTFGAQKYSDHGWLAVEDGESRYMDALYRHLLSDQERDAESGELHLAHAAWNILAVLELRLRASGGTSGCSYDSSDLVQSEYPGAEFNRATIEKLERGLELN